MQVSAEGRGLLQALQSTKAGILALASATVEAEFHLCTASVESSEGEMLVGIPEKR